MEAALVIPEASDNSYAGARTFNSEARAIGFWRCGTVNSQKCSDMISSVKQGFVPKFHRWTGDEASARIRFPFPWLRKALWVSLKLFLWVSKDFIQFVLSILSNPPAKNYPRSFTILHSFAIIHPLVPQVYHFQELCNCTTILHHHEAPTHRRRRSTCLLVHERYAPAASHLQRVLRYLTLPSVRSSCTRNELSPSINRKVAGLALAMSST